MTSLLNTSFALLLVLIEIVNGGPARQTPFPPIVLKCLNTLYPATESVEWTKWGKNYQADFIYNSHNISLTFNKEGKIVKSMEEVDLISLPLEIKSVVEKKYNGYKVIYSTKNKDQHKVEYELEVVKGHLHHILNFNALGKFLAQYEISKYDVANNQHLN